MNQQYCQVTTTFTRKSEAQKMGKLILENRLAACVQITAPVDSLYWWQDEIENAKEYIVNIKTTKSVYKALEKLITNHHSYDTPEIVVTPITGGSSSYLDWISQEVRNSIK